MRTNDVPPSAPFAPRHTLSETEIKLLDLVVRGLTVRQIAEQAGLAESTVERYVQKLRIKMSAQNNVQLVANSRDKLGQNVKTKGIASAVYLRLLPTDKTILELLARGWTAREIGDHVNLNFRTIERCIENLRLKMNARNTTHLIANAFTTGALRVVRGDVKAGVDRIELSRKRYAALKGSPS